MSLILPGESRILGDWNWTAVVKLDRDPHAGQNREELFQQSVVSPLPSNPENQPGEVLIILRVDPIGREDGVVGLEEFICRKAVLFRQSIEALLGRGNDVVDNPDI